MAVLYLKSKGFLLIKRRYKSQNAEIDLICNNQKYIVFAEVKFRKSKNTINSYLNYEDCKKIYSSAECFLQEFPKFLSLTPLFKIFLFTPSMMSVRDLY